MTSVFGFDNEKYLNEQSKEILERVKKFNNKLYLEFGGKLGYDFHAARILPGYDANVKLKLLQQLKDKIEFILCIYSRDIAEGKILGNFGITYDHAILKLIDDLKELGLDKFSIVITRFKSEPAVVKFKDKLERRGLKIYTHQEIENYPIDVDHVVSDEGFGKNCYIPTERPIVVVNGPGPNSGKMATCLSQLYHDHKNGLVSGYAKFETFPIWNLPLDHLVNVAYEAATADIGDYNVIDPFHLKAYNKTAVNYNRDVETFPILKRILEKIAGDNQDLPYQSPTDMGVNKAGYAIINENIVNEACRQELIRRYFRYICEHALGLIKNDVVKRIEALLEQNNISLEERKVIEPARLAGQDAYEKGEAYQGIACGAALQLKNGLIITGHNSQYLHAASAVFLKSLKALIGLDKEIHLIPSEYLEQVSQLKKEIFNSASSSLDLNEVLMSLFIYASFNQTVKSALGRLKDLKNCEMHMTHLPTAGDEKALKVIGINVTSDPHFSSSNLFEV